jgi:hypothetical protein
MIGPDAPDILDIAKGIYELLEPKIEEVYITEFYRSFFEIADDISFFELKIRLKWFALHSYIPGYEFSLKVRDEALLFFEEHPDFVRSEETADQMKYAFEEDYLYAKRSSLSAFSSLEWFSEVANGSKEIKRHILNLEKRIMTMFIYEGEDERYYKFSEKNTGKQMEVRKESVTLDTRNIKGREMFFLSLVKWNGDWWMSGTLLGWGESDGNSPDPNAPNAEPPPFYLFNEKEQANLRENTELMGRHFQDYFQDQFILLKNEEELQKAVNSFFQYHNERLDIQEKARQSTDKPSVWPNKKADWKSSASGVTGELALTFIPGEGIQMNPSLGESIRMMWKKKASPEEKQQLFFTLLGESTHPATARYLIEHLPTQNLAFPIPASKVDALENAEFLMRFLHPNDFASPIPRVHGLSRGR